MAEETHDFPNPPQDSLNPGPEPSSSRAKNRPATGARQASPDEVFSQEFQGTATAGDFLGLDLEFIGASHSSGGLDLTPPPQIGEGFPEPQDAYTTEMGDDLDALPAEDAGVDGELSDLPMDDAVEGFDDLDAEIPAVGPRDSRKKVLIGAGALVAAGVAAYFFVPGLGSKSVSVADVGEVAKRPTTSTPRAPKTTPPAASTSTPEPAPTAQPVETFVTPSPSTDLTVATTGSDTDLGGERTFSLGRTLGEIFGDESAAGDVATVDPGLDSATESVASVFGITEPDPASAAFPDFNQGYEWVSEDMLDMIWRGTEIPMEAIYAPTRILMPRVGMVRLFMKSGEVFEGRVYAVGQNLIWLETAPGRVGLDGDAFERYEHLAVEDVPESGDSVPQGELVRVRVPGGFLDGRVLSREAGMTTVVTDTGGRITIADAVVEPLQTSRAKVLKY
jgi:hypothetical protein